jgi:hypothetical protein
MQEIMYTALQKQQTNNIILHNDDRQSAVSVHLTEATLNTEAGSYFQTLAATCHST